MAIFTLPREYSYAGGRAAKVAGFAIIAALLFLYARQASLVFWADRQFSRSNFDGLKRAAQLEPNDSLYLTTLAQYYLYTMNDPETAKSLLNRACRLDPNTARCWLDAAAADLVLGDSAGQRMMLERAVEVDPTTPSVAWEAASFYLVQGEYRPALSLARIVVDYDPENAPLALERCWQATHDVNAILRWTISPGSQRRGTLLQIVLNSGDDDAAGIVWRNIVHSDAVVPASVGLQYFDALIRHRDIGGAISVWHDLTARQAVTDTRPAGELVVNGGFEHPVANGGFDWRYRQQDYLTVAVDDQTFHAGHNSVRFNFDHIFLVDAGWSEFVPVEAGRYHFSAFARSEELDAAYGPRFEVHDAYSGALLFSTNDVLGTTTWREYSGDVTFPPDTRLVRISVGRAESQAPVMGKLWIDDVSLVQAAEKK